MKTQFNVRTAVFEAGLIEQTVESESQGVARKIGMSVINTQDDQIRKALIELGWTPPIEKVSISDTPPQPTALSNQVNGDHYKTAIQPIEYIHANELSFVEGNVIKYITRWRKKGGIADLEKIKHYIDLLIELETKGE